MREKHKKFLKVIKSRDLGKKSEREGKRGRGGDMMSAMKSGRCAVTCRTEERNSCAHKIRRSGNLQLGLFANKISPRVKRSRGVVCWKGGRLGEDPTRYDGNMTRRYSEQVPSACLEFGVSTTLKVRAPPLPSPLPLCDTLRHHSISLLLSSPTTSAIAYRRAYISLSRYISLSLVRTPLH